MKVSGAASEDECHKNDCLSEIGMRKSLSLQGERSEAVVQTYGWHTCFEGRRASENLSVIMAGLRMMTRSAQQRPSN
jgi:hypothetical protein